MWKLNVFNFWADKLKVQTPHELIHELSPLIRAANEGRWNINEDETSLTSNSSWIKHVPSLGSSTVVVHCWDSMQPRSTVHKHSRDPPSFNVFTQDDCWLDTYSSGPTDGPLRPVKSNDILAPLNRGNDLRPLLCGVRLVQLCKMSM